jgi:hypothetical protein
MTANWSDRNARAMPGAVVAALDRRDPYERLRDEIHRQVGHPELDDLCAAYSLAQEPDEGVITCVGEAPCLPVARHFQQVRDELQGERGRADLMCAAPGC